MNGDGLTGHRMAASALLVLLCGALAQGGEDVDLHWRFDAGESWTVKSVAALKARGWAVNPAADRDDALFVQTDRLGEVTGFLKLVDVVDSAAAGLDNAGGTPTVTLPIAAAASGTLTLGAALEGAQQQHAVIALRRGTTELASVALTDNTRGRLRVGTRTEDFTDGVKWFMSSREIRFAWQPGEGGGVRITVTFTPREGKAITLQGDAPAGPDQLLLSVGFGTAVNRALMIDELHLQTHAK